MIAQQPGVDKAFIALLGCLLVSFAAAEPAVQSPETLGRAGPATIDAAGFRAAVAEARVLERWRTGREAPLAALRSADLRRRLTIKALETQVVRQTVARLGLQPEPEALRRALANALVSRPHDAPVASIPTDLDAKLAARFEAPVATVRRVAADLLEGDTFSAHLLDAVPDATHRARWLRANTKVVVDLLRVPRVPTGSEIEAVVGLQADDIDIWYDIHRERFNRPEKARVRRALAQPASDDAAAWAAAERRAEAWAARLTAGAALDAVMGEGDGSEARRGGRFGRATREQLPQAFSVDPGGHTQPIREPDGWAVYHVEAFIPALVRPRHDRPVRREIAATLLRETDVLPHARHIAERARLLLKMRPDGAVLPELIKAERLKRSTTPPFAQSERTLVPGIGIAPDLVEAIFALRAPGAVTSVVRVRQDYVIARLVRRDAPDPATWPQARAAWIEQWRAGARRTVIQDWLSETLRGAPLWLDMPRIANLDIPGVGTAVDKRGEPLTAPERR